MPKRKPVKRDADEIFVDQMGDLRHYLDQTQYRLRDLLEDNFTEEGANRPNLFEFIDEDEIQQLLKLSERLYSSYSKWYWNVWCPKYQKPRYEKQLANVLKKLQKKLRKKLLKKLRNNLLEMLHGCGCLRRK